MTYAPFLLCTCRSQQQILHRHVDAHGHQGLPKNSPEADAYLRAVARCFKSRACGSAHTLCTPQRERLPENGWLSWGRGQAGCCLSIKTACVCFRALCASSNGKAT
ncbi:hypothetical protein [Eikenella sp. NML03-A-027]|uniref:hypothetical protein n=1 Tax=Eikenella sp. NML03-A-027 TaxID=1795828 RepID=UPI000A437EA7|nr:hypothetical protein [Eikenella sp. NML03-A-027]